MDSEKRMSRGGWTIRELAEKTGFSTNTIIRYTSEPRKDYLARADEKRERIRELRSQGLTIRAIADETGYSIGTVHRYVKEVEKSAA